MTRPGSLIRRASKLYWSDFCLSPFSNPAVFRLFLSAWNQAGKKLNVPMSVFQSTIPCTS